jgi:hypothetical protein
MRTRKPRKRKPAPMVCFTITVRRAPGRAKPRTLQILRNVISLSDPVCEFADSPDVRELLARGETITHEQVQAGIYIVSTIELDRRT